MNLVVDMNLSKLWVTHFLADGWGAVHWSAVGPPPASDDVIRAWADANRHVVFTADTGFGQSLARTKAIGPSVVQIPDRLAAPATGGAAVLAALHAHHAALLAGALVIVTARGSRVRPLPLP